MSGQFPQKKLSVAILSRLCYLQRRLTGLLMGLVVWAFCAAVNNWGDTWNSIRWWAIMFELFAYKSTRIILSLPAISKDILLIYG